MSFDTIKRHRTTIKKIGPWSGIRYLRNLGIGFEDAYFIMFDRQPRIV